MNGRPLRVVLACDFFVRYSAHLAAGMVEQGVDVMLLTRDHDLEFGGVPGSAEAFVRDAVGPGVEHLRLPGRVRSPQGLREMLRVRRSIREFDPDVVHVQSSILNDPRLAYAVGLRRREFALTTHNPSPHPGESPTKIDRLANDLLAKTAGLIFVHGEALRAELAGEVTTSAPVVVVPHGVDPVKPLPLPPAPSILFFGRIEKYKGLDVLLDAMPPVWESLPAATLTIAGQGRLPEHRILADPRVRVLNGYVDDDDVEGLFESAGCVALPYVKASQSGVGSLAKRYGRPLVVTSVGALPELVSDGSGLVAEPGDPETLARQVTAVLNDSELADRLAEAGVRSATDGSSWAGVAELTLRAYREYLPVPGEPPDTARSKSSE